MPKQHHHQHGSESETGHHVHIPYWKRAHTDWRFWIGIILMFVAMMVYVITGDLAWRPRLRPPQPPSAPTGR